MFQITCNKNSRLSRGCYSEKKEIGMLKSEAETPKEENSKLKQDMCEKEILIKRLTETVNEEKAT